MTFDILKPLRRDVARIGLALGIPRARQLYHVAPTVDLASIKNRGLDPPVFMLNSWEAVESLKEATKEVWEKYGKTREETSVLLRIDVPPDWPLRADEAFPKTTDISDSRILPRNITVIDDDFWGHIA